MDAGHRHGLRDVDRDDAGVGMRAAERVPPQHSRRVEVARVRELSLHLGRPVGPADGLADVAELEPGRRLGGGRRHACSRGPHRVEDLLVAGAAAEVAREGLADLVVRRARRVIEQVDGGDDQAGRAEPALHGAGGEKRLLDAVQRTVLGDALDGDDVVPVGLRREDEARADERAVEQHRARSALALLARVLRAGQLELLAEREEEALAAPDVGLAQLAVDGQLDLHARHRSSARRVRTREGMATVGGGAADVVDRARALGDEVREAVGLVQRRRDERARSARPTRTRPGSRPAPRSTWRASEQTEMTIAFRGPTFMNVCRPRARVDPDADDELVGGERVLLHAEQELGRAAAGAPRGRSRCPPRRPRRAAAAARRRPATPCRGCPRSCRGCGSAASRPCATPRRAPAARRRPRPVIASA